MSIRDWLAHWSVLGIASLMMIGSASAQLQFATNRDVCKGPLGAPPVTGVITPDGILCPELYSPQGVHIWNKLGLPWLVMHYQATIGRLENDIVALRRELEEARSANEALVRGTLEQALGRIEKVPETVAASPSVVKAIASEVAVQLRADPEFRNSVRTQ